MNADKLIAFRQTAYKYLGRAHDAMFELGDAVLSSPRVNSFAELSCSPLFRRQWSSLYEALQDSRPQRRKLMRLYIEQMNQAGRPVIAGDHTIWARPYAVTLQERTYEHQATMLGNRPVGVGQGWSTLTWIPEAGTSWALPLRHERITSFESPISKAAWQLRQVCQALKVRAISLWDSEYGCARFVLATADIACDKLMRLRSNRCGQHPLPIAAEADREYMATSSSSMTSLPGATLTSRARWMTQNRDGCAYSAGISCTFAPPSIIQCSSY